MKLTQKNFDELIMTLNHKVSLIEGDIKWIKKIGYYMCAILTGILIRGFI